MVRKLIRFALVKFCFRGGNVQTIFTLFTYLFLVTSVNGSLVLYDFTGQPGDQTSTAATSVAPGLTASAIVRGAGVTASAAGNSMSASGWTTSSSADTDDYYGFTITPNPTNTITLTNISFAERRSGTGIRTFEIRSSLDSFSSAIAGTVTGVPDDTNTRNQSFTLGASFANLSTAVTLRIYGYAAEGSTGTWRLANHTTDNGLLIDGTVVPEPTSIALCGLVCSLVGAGALFQRLWIRCILVTACNKRS